MRHAVDGKGVSGVAVATMIASTSEPSTPARSSACLEAGMARSDVAMFSSV